MQFNDYWNDTHKKFFDGKITYDNWLDYYKDILNACKTKVLDLGAGRGNDTLYLTEKGFKVIACDYSDVALKIIKEQIPSAETILLDISNSLPFENNSFDIIIADLSLHYFDEQTTIRIMKEIKRILRPNGHLLARVNSTEDTNHGAGQGEKIEENFYFVEGYNKRFFNFKDIDKYFSIIGKVNARENDMLRYQKPKKVIEVDVKKRSVIQKKDQLQWSFLYVFKLLDFRI